LRHIADEAAIAITSPDAVHCLSQARADHRERGSFSVHQLLSRVKRRARQVAGGREDKKTRRALPGESFTSRDGILPSPRRYTPMADSAEFFSRRAIYTGK